MKAKNTVILFLILAITICLGCGESNNTDSVAGEKKSSSGEIESDENTYSNEELKEFLEEQKRAEEPEEEAAKEVEEDKKAEVVEEEKEIKSENSVSESENTDKEEGKIHLIPELEPLRNIETYGQFKEEYGDIAEYDFYVNYIAPIPGTGLWMNIGGSTTDTGDVTLDDNGMCDKVMGRINDFFTTEVEKTNIDDFVESISYENAAEVDLGSYGGSDTGHNVGEWTVYTIVFDSNADGEMDTSMEIGADEDNSISGESSCWMRFVK